MFKRKLKKMAGKSVAILCIVILGTAGSIGVSPFPGNIKAITSNIHSYSIHSYSITNSQLSECVENYEAAIKQLFSEDDKIMKELPSLSELKYGSEEYLINWRTHTEKILDSSSDYWSGFESSADKNSYFTSQSINRLYTVVKQNYDIIHAYINKCSVRENQLINNYPENLTGIKEEYDSAILYMNKMQAAVLEYMNCLIEISDNLEKYESATPVPIQTKTPAVASSDPAITNNPGVQPTTIPTATPTTNVNVSVMYAANGGTFEHGNTTITKYYLKGSAQIITSENFPSRDGYMFDGYVCANGTITYDATGNFYIYIVPDNGDILTAQWKKIETAVPTQEPTPTILPITETPAQTPNIIISTPNITQQVDTTTVPVTQIPMKTATPDIIPITEVPVSTLPASITTASAQTIKPIEPTATIPVRTTTPVALKTKTITIGRGEKVIFPLLNKKGNKITYRIANKKVAAVTSKGKITGKQIGNTKAYAVSNGKKYTMTVKVKKKPVSVKISKVSNLQMSKGDKLILQAILNKGAASYHLQWKSSNKKVITVSSLGVASIKGKGKATITVKTYNGVTGKLKITIK